MDCSPDSPLPIPDSLSGVRFRLATPHPGSSGAAISIIHVEADSASQLDGVLKRLGVGDAPVGKVLLRRIARVDTGMVVRWTPTVVHLMPHGGAIIVQRICEALMNLGATDGSSTPYPESSDLVEACAMEAIARASSPLAIDVILRQRECWRSGARLAAEEDARALHHLLAPPTVVLFGPPNIGKSTLTNALARRQVSIVADEPGTTRDHVGVMLDLSGLVVRWIDAPGINPSTSDPIERAAIALALGAAKNADLILLCADSTREPPDFDAAAAPILRVALRADLGPPRGMTPDIATSAKAGTGIAELAAVVHGALVPSRLLSTPFRWRFHPSLPTQTLNPEP